MMLARFFGGAMGLREAVAVVFALVAVLPTLLLIYLLGPTDLVYRPEARLGLTVALVLSIVGYLVLRRLTGQIIRVARGLQASAAGEVPEHAEERDAAIVAGFSGVTEIAQLGQAFRQMLRDLREATKRLEDLVFKLGTLNETVELAARIPRIQDLLGLVLQNTMRAVRAPVGSIMILDRERQVLRVAVSRGLPDEVIARAEVKLGEGITGKVAELGEPVVVDDTAADRRFGEPNAPGYGRGSFICMP